MNVVCMVKFSLVTTSTYQNITRAAVGILLDTSCYIHLIKELLWKGRVANNRLILKRNVSQSNEAVSSGGCLAAFNSFNSTLQKTLYFLSILFR